MLGFSPLASAPLGGDSDRARASLAGRFAGGIDLSGSAYAYASVRSKGAAVVDLAATSGGSSANSAAINGASIVIGFASAKSTLKSLAATAVGITGDSGASVRLAARSLTSWDGGGLLRAGVSTRAVSSEDFVVARASSADVETISGVSTSMAFVLTASALSVRNAGATGNLALAGSSVSSALIKPVLSAAVAFDGHGKAGATLAANLDDQFAIFGNIAAQNASLAVAVGGITAAVSSSGTLFMRAKAEGDVHLARSILAVAEVAAQADTPILPSGSSVGISACGARASGVVTLSATGSGSVSSDSAATGSFIALTQSEAGNPVDVLSSRALGLVGVSVGRAKTKAGGAGVGNLSGTAGTGTAIGASAQAVLAFDGQTAGCLVSQAQAGGGLDILYALDAAALVHSAAARDIDLTGSTAAKVEARTTVDVITLFGGEVSGAVATNGVTEATAVLQGVAAAQTGITSAANFALTLIGRSSVSSLSPLFGQAIAGISIDGQARVGASVSATAASEVGLGATATGVAPLRSAVRGAVVIAGPSETGIAILGQSGRSIPISGVATSALGMGSEVTGALAVQGTATIMAPRVVISAGTVQLSGATGMRGAVSGAGRAVFDTALQADGAVPLPAVAGSLLVLDAIAHAVAASGGTGFSLLSLSGQSAADVTATVQTGGTVALTPDAAGAVVSAGTARGVIDVLRALAGDAVVTGDAVRQIGIGGHAVGEIALNGRAPEGALNLAAAITASASASVSAQGELGFAGEAVVALDIGAGAKPGLGIAMTTTAVVGLITTATPTVLFGGAAGMRVAARGSAQSEHGIDRSATCATAAAGRAGGALVLDLHGMAQSGVSGSGIGAMEITRAVLGTVPVTAQAARSMPIGGSGAGSAANAGKATLARLRVTLATAAQLRTRAEAAVASAVDGSGGARALTTGTARIDLGFVRLGLGEVAVAGATLRGIALLGDASVRVDAVAAANANVVPGLQSTASNIIAIAFTGQAQVPQAVSAANTITTCRSPAGLLEARGTGIGYRAPPALRRSELPNSRQGGNLTPSLRSGRIVQG